MAFRGPACTVGHLMRPAAIFLRTCCAVFSLCLCSSGLWLSELCCEVKSSEYCWARGETFSPFLLLNRHPLFQWMCQSLKQKIGVGRECGRLEEGNIATGNGRSCIGPPTLPAC